MFYEGVKTCECLLLSLGRGKPPVTSGINCPFSKYLYFHLLSHDFQCVSRPENRGTSMCSFQKSLISMSKVQPKAGAEVTFPVRGPTTQEKKQFGTEENIFILS